MRKVIEKGRPVGCGLELATVQAHHVGVLFIDGDFVETLPPGCYAFWKNTDQVKFVGGACARRCSTWLARKS